MLKPNSTSQIRRCPQLPANQFCLFLFLSLSVSLSLCVLFKYMRSYTHVHTYLRKETLAHKSSNTDIPSQYSLNIHTYTFIQKKRLIVR